MKTYISGNDIFFAGMKADADTKLKLMRITHDPVSAVWAKQVNCPSTSWTINFSEAIISGDGSRIYAFIPYGNPIEAIFFILDASTGSVVENKYRSNSVDWTAMHLHGNNLYITLFQSIILYNTSTDTFKMFKSLSWNILMAVQDPTSDRYSNLIWPHWHI